MKVTRIVCLVLVALMLLPMLFACNKNPEGGEGNEGAGSNGVVDNVLGGTNAAGETWPDDGLGTQDFGGRVIRVLGWKEASGINEFDMEEDFKKTTLNSAVYTRNENVKARMNVDFKFNYTEGQSGSEHQYAEEAQKQVNSSSVDMFVSYSRVGNIMMVTGLIRDLQTSDYIDFTKPWWSAGLIDSSSIWGRTYFCAGDISWTLMSQTIMICFNKNMLAANPEILDEFEVESMYQMVEKKKWTIPNMIKLAKNFAAEGEKDATDTFGFTASSAVPMDAFYKGSDLKWLESSPDGSVKVSEDQHSQKANDLVLMLTEFFKTASAGAHFPYSEADSYGGPAWLGGRSLFYLNAIDTIISKDYANKSFAFGVLPMPMFDESQTAYKTTPGFWYSLWSVPRAVTGAEEICCVIECMASEGYRHIGPAYYSETLKKQSSDSTDDYIMWETIKSSIELDGGRMFDWQFDQCRIWGLFRGALQNGHTAMTENWDRYGGTMIGEAGTLNSKMKALEKKLG